LFFFFSFLFFPRIPVFGNSTTRFFSPHALAFVPCIRVRFPFFHNLNCSSWSSLHLAFFRRSIHFLPFFPSSSPLILGPAFPLRDLSEKVVSPNLVLSCPCPSCVFLSFFPGCSQQNSICITFFVPPILQVCSHVPLAPSPKPAALTIPRLASVIFFRCFFDLPSLFPFSLRACYPGDSQFPWHCSISFQLDSALLPVNLCKPR